MLRWFTVEGVGAEQSITVILTQKTKGCLMVFPGQSTAAVVTSEHRKEKEDVRNCPVR